jgi:hypothetical protein
LLAQDGVPSDLVDRVAHAMIAIFVTLDVEERRISAPRVTPRSTADLMQHILVGALGPRNEMAVCLSHVVRCLMECVLTLRSWKERGGDVVGHGHPAGRLIIDSESDEEVLEAAAAAEDRANAAANHVRKRRRRMGRYIVEEADECHSGSDQSATPVSRPAKRNKKKRRGIEKDPVCSQCMMRIEHGDDGVFECEQCGTQRLCAECVTPCDACDTLLCCECECECECAHSDTAVSPQKEEQEEAGRGSPAAGSTQHGQQQTEAVASLKEPFWSPTSVFQFMGCR